MKKRLLATLLCLIMVMALLPTTAFAASTISFSPVGGTYTSAQSVTLSCNTADAAIYYTDDGSEPTKSSTQYSEAISIRSTTTLKAKAFTDDTESETALATYTISDAPTVTSVWIWGKELTSETPYYHNGVNGTQGTANNVAEGANAIYNTTESTLTLDNLNVADSTATKSITIENETTSFTYGIFAEGDLDINVTANSVVSTGATAAGNANVAVGIKGDVTFTGTGTARLTATSGTGKSTAGVYVLGDFEVSSGCLSGSAGAAGGEATAYADSFGVSTMGTLTFSGGTLYGTGNMATATNGSMSVGIGAGDVTVTGGEITATGKTATAPYALSYGLYVTSLDIQGGDNQANGGEAAGGGAGSFSAGVASHGDISVSGGSLSGRGETATATGTARSQSYGIYAEADSVSFSGGTVNSTGKQAGYESCGIKNAGNRNNDGEYIDGGTIAVSDTANVSATGGDAQFCYGLTAYKDINVTGGTIQCYGNGTASSGNVGVSVPNGSVTVSGGRMISTAAAANNYSYGINAPVGDIDVTGGWLTAKTTAGSGIRSALNKELNPGINIKAKGSTSSDGSSPVNYVGANNNSYMWVETILSVPVLTVAASQAGSVAVGTAVTLTATPTNIADPSYQWYSNTVNETTGATQINGATEATYSPLTTTVGTMYYYCMVGTTTSNIIGVTVTAPNRPPVYNNTTYYRLTFKTNGGSAVFSITCEKGKAIDLASYSSTRMGYTFTGWYADKELTDRITELRLTENMTVYAGWSEKESLNIYFNNPFADVKESDWFFEDAMFAYSNKLMHGTGDSRFSPELPASRGMIVTILYRLEGEPAVTDACPFDDVKSGSYYEKSITWAAATGIVNGYGNDTFGPDDPMTREQMAAILYRYAQSKGYDVSVGEDTNILSYNDAFDISEYAIAAIQWGCGAGIIQGDAGNLMPTEIMQRCQTAAILHRFCKSITE